MSAQLMEDDDAELARRSRGGDLDAWKTLAARHAPRLAAYLGTRLRRPLLVEKLVGLAVIQGWRHLPDLGEGEEFGPWYRKLGASLALGWHKEHAEEPLDEPFPAERCAGDDALAESMRELEEALGRLPELQRRVIEERYRGGQEVPRIAAALRLGEAETQRLLDAAVDALAQGLDQP